MKATERQKLSQDLAKYITNKLPDKGVGYLLVVHDFSDDATTRAVENQESATSVRSNFSIDELPDVINLTSSELMAREAGIGNVDEGQVGKEPDKQFSEAEKTARRSTPLDDLFGDLG